MFLSISIFIKESIFQRFNCLEFKKVMKKIFSKNKYLAISFLY